MRTTRAIGTVACLSTIWLILQGCATLDRPQCPPGTHELPDCPPLSAIVDPDIEALYDSRTWRRTSDLDFDPIEWAKAAEIPIQHARARFLGPTDEAARASLAAKIWMIENARHTIDFVYYIFKRDLIGYAFVGAMCDAVQRGVDVRVLVDGLGSFHSTHSELKALQACSESAAFMRNAEGRMTTRKARVQVVVFNAMSKVLTNPNRRSHDKILVVDGHFPEHAAVITGGRNVSQDYYGILPDGGQDPNPYRDAEIVVRAQPETDDGEVTVGEVSELYAGVLMLFKDNKRLRARGSLTGAYRDEIHKARESLATLKSFELFDRHYGAMDAFWETGFHDAQVRLAHELGNLTDRKVTTEIRTNQNANPNSIMNLMNRISEERPNPDSFRIVSPYLFLAKYKDKKTGEVFDEAAGLRQWLTDHPGATLEIVTNSVLTSDNFSAQAIIDMDTAPRLLFDDEMHLQWVEASGPGETESELVTSEEWADIVSHPRVALYETGRLDSSLLGGEASYGKLHAKFFIEDEIGFVGTSNFDYRSRLYNNEMGFFFVSDELAEDVHEGIDHLIESSYRWGTPEWFLLRQAVMQIKGAKGTSTRQQRRLYRFFTATGFHWYL